jgi:hypothetical protein
VDLANPRNNGSDIYIDSFMVIKISLLRKKKLAASWVAFAGLSVIR